MIKKFLNYVEITTKITSVFPFLMAVAYLLLIKQPIHAGLTLLFFASMFLFDLTTTAINNYMDTKSNGQSLPFKRKTGLYIIVCLFGVSTALGIYLACLTDVVVLLLGGLCFLCGVLYSYGPLPISHLPLGEFFSGIFYGLLIPFILFYMNMPKGTYFTLNLQDWQLTLGLAPLAAVLLLAIPPICLTANIMLANNICDVEKDVLVKRYTLAYYLGKRALYLFALLYYLPYLAMVIMVGTGTLPPLCLVSLMTIIPVQRNINRFMKKQEKATTFILAVKNYVIVMAVHTLMIFISGLFH